MTLMQYTPLAAAVVGVATCVAFIILCGRACDAEHKAVEDAEACLKTSAGGSVKTSKALGPAVR